MNKKLIAVLLSLSITVPAYNASFAEGNSEITEIRNDKTVQEEKSQSDKDSQKESGDTQKSDDKSDNSSEKENSDSASDKSEKEKTDADKDKAEKTDNADKKEVSDKIDASTELYNFLGGNNDIIRINGKNRAETSIKISRFENVKSDTVIVTDSNNYPDALSASSLTKGENPIILVNRTISDDALNEIKRLSPKKIIILGGISSVPAKVENTLKGIENVDEVKRISGKDRYQTNRKILEELDIKDVVIASGENYPDALSSSSLLDNSGLMLVKNANPDTVNVSFKNSPETASIIGGYSSVNSKIEEKISNRYNLKSIERINGKNRYETSTKVAEKIKSDTAIIASGEVFSDALSASSLAQKMKSPILLVSRDVIDQSVIDYIGNNNIRKLVVVGGESTISPNTYKNLQRVAEGKLPENNFKVVNLGSFAVTKSSVKLYKDEDLQNEISQIPVKKIVDIKNQDVGKAYIEYNGKSGWVSKEQLKNYNSKEMGTVVNKVPYESQLYPVYAPNGCEPTSMLMGLKGKGYTKIGLRAFLDDMPKTSSNPRKGYVGVPYNVEQGRFQTIDPEPLAKWGRKYGDVQNISGQPIEKIIREIQNGNTVVAYETLFWNNAYYKTLKVDGKPERRIWNNHVVLLTGYNPFNRTFYVADPYNHEKAGGNRRSQFYYWKSENTVNRCYNYDNRRFAVVIR